MCHNILLPLRPPGHGEMELHQPGQVQVNTPPTLILHRRAHTPTLLRNGCLRMAAGLQCPMAGRHHQHTLQVSKLPHVTRRSPSQVHCQWSRTHQKEVLSSQLLSRYQRRMLPSQRPRDLLRLLSLLLRHHMSRRRIARVSQYIVILLYQY